MKLDLVLACDSEQKEDEPAGSNPTEPSAADVPSTNVAQVPSPVAPETPSSTTSGLPGPAVSASSAPAVAASATPPEVAVDVANIGLHIGGGPNDVTKSPILTSLEPHFPAFRACFAREEEPRAHGPSISLRTAERQDDAEEDSSRYAAAKRRGAALKRTDRLARMARLALPSAVSDDASQVAQEKREHHPSAARARQHGKPKHPFEKPRPRTMAASVRALRHVRRVLRSDHRGDMALSRVPCTR